MRPSCSMQWKWLEYPRNQACWTRLRFTMGHCALSGLEKRWQGSGHLAAMRNSGFAPYRRSFQPLTDDLESGRSFTRSRTAVIRRRAVFPLHSCSALPGRSWSGEAGVANTVTISWFQPRRRFVCRRSRRTGPYRLFRSSRPAFLRNQTDISRRQSAAVLRRQLDQVSALPI